MSNIQESPIHAWDAFAEAYDMREGEDGDAFRKERYDPIVQDMLGSLQGKQVLDAGCGNGYWSKKLLAMGASNVIAVDSSPKLVEISKIRLAGLPVTVHLNDLSTDSLPAEDNSCNIVLSSLVLDYVVDLPHFLSESRRVLKKNGKLIIGVQHPGYHVDQVLLENPSYQNRGGSKKVTKPSFEKTVELPVIVRTISEYLNTASQYGLTLERLEEIMPEVSNEEKGIKPITIPFRFQDGSGIDCTWNGNPRIMIMKLSNVGNN